MAKYVVENAITCDALEKEMGMVAGSVKQLTIYPGGAVEYETVNPLSAADQDKMKTELSKRGLPRGNKPAREA